MTGQSLADVRKDELLRVADRRRVETGKDSEAELRGSLVGLALSGGGVRSAATSLGLLQSLARRGVLPAVDFLSTVSGGGYAGAFVTSSAAEQAIRNPRPKGTATSGEHEWVRHLTGVEGRQPQRVIRLIFGNSFLRRHLALASRYLASLALMWTLILSGLVAFASLAALAYGCLWTQESQAVLSALGFRSDLAIALFPTAVLGTLWLVAWGLSCFRNRRRAEGIVARGLFALMLAAASIGAAGLLGAGELSFQTSSGMPQNQATTTATAATTAAATQLQTNIRWVLFSLIGTSLLPYLTPRNLIRSGVAPRGFLDRVAFWWASRAMVFGVPFLAIAFFARENISHFNETRGAFHVKDFLWTNTRGSFWMALNPWRPSHLTPAPPPVANVVSRDEVMPTLAENFWKQKVRLRIDKGRLRKTDPGAAPGRSGLDVLRVFRTLATRENGIRDYESSAGWLGGWWFLGTHAVGSVAFRDTKSEFGEYLRDKEDVRVAREGIVAALNDALLDPKLPLEKAVVNSPRFEEDLKSSSVMKLVEECEYWKREASEQDQVLASAGGPSRDAASEQPRDEAAKCHTHLGAARRRLLLKLYGSQYFHDADQVFAYVVLDADQRVRRQWLFYSSLVFLVALLAINLNGTSLHGFYASDLARTWIANVPGLPDGELPLSQMNTSLVGCPIHLISATWHRFGRRRHDDYGEREPFLFSPLYCGSESLGFAPTSTYMRGQFMLADAIAISGGALNPLQVQQPLTRLLLAMANLRLGQWVRNPGAQRGGGALESAPNSPLLLLLTMFWSAEQRSRCFVSDGGLVENLGIEPLLVRRCRVIVALDAGQDREQHLADFAKLVRWAQVRHGIRFEPWDTPGRELDVSSVTPAQAVTVTPSATSSTAAPADARGASPFSPSHFLVCRILYPHDPAESAQGSPDEGILVFIKSSLTGDEPADVLGHWRQNPEFPHDSTTNQLFDEAMFTSYLHLGTHLGDSVACDLWGAKRTWSPAELCATLARRQVRDEDGAVAREVFTSHALEGQTHEADHMLECTEKSGGNHNGSSHTAEHAAAGGKKRKAK